MHRFAGKFDEGRQCVEEDCKVEVWLNANILPSVSQVKVRGTQREREAHYYGEVADRRDGCGRTISLGGFGRRILRQGRAKQRAPYTFSAQKENGATHKLELYGGRAICAGRDHAIQGLIQGEGKEP